MKISNTNATSVTLHPCRQVIWGYSWKCTVGISPSNAVYMYFFQQFRGGGNLKLHFMRHSGVKPNHCYQCNFSYFEEGTFKKHLKIHSEIHSEEKPNVCNQYDFASAWPGWQLEGTSVNTQCGKIKQMQSMQLCLLLGEVFEEPIENTQWRIAKY